MKVINKILVVVLFALSASLLTGCFKDLLEKNPPTAISDSNFWTGESDAHKALVACYKSENGWSHDNFDSPQGLIYLDFAGGNGTEKENFTTLMASVNTMPTNSNISGYWSNSYSHIAHCNTFLDNIENCRMDEAKIKEYKAEVLCIRAFYFIKLAFYFNNVPMPLTTLSLEDANTITQTPQAEVYKQAEKDLLEALQSLPLTRSGNDYGRYTKGAAQAILGRLYLAQGRYEDAVTMYRSIMDSNVYSIDRSNGDQSYEKLFQIGGEYSKEIIFCHMGVKDKFTTARYQYLYPEVNGGWHQFAVYNELVKDYFCADGLSIEESPTYDKKDPYVNREIRLYASVFLPPVGSYPGTEFLGKVYNCYGGGSSNDAYNKFPLFNGYCPKKATDPSINSSLGSTYTYTPVIRYAEVLLSYLEALNESNPSAVDQSVLDKTINDIRSRALLPALSKSDLSTQEAVRKAVRKERRVELAFEGLRYFDVLRWNEAQTLLNHTFTGVLLSDDPTAPNYRGSGDTASPVDEDGYYKFEERAWDAHNRYFPIPQSDMNVNRNLVQNPGY
ncbi:MAG: RagB/SusD family nutrient uptake outer membrane protein [Bacteroidales bacterium]|nr:RagB/SusD family nutrient uptake outer membrane protein [Bacteroidales bacterium]